MKFLLKKVSDFVEHRESVHPLALVCGFAGKIGIQASL